MISTDIKIEHINIGSDIETVVNIHMKTFTGFFLTFLGRGFLRCMYNGFASHESSGIYGAYEDGKLLGFLAYSTDISDFYKYLIKTRFFGFAWYAFLGVLRKPSTALRLFRSLTYPKETKREEKYIELASIGVLPEAKNKGVGSRLIEHLKNNSDFEKYKYIKLETDAVNNDAANEFYKKNLFVLCDTYTTAEGRIMNEYRFSK